MDTSDEHGVLIGRLEGKLDTILQFLMVDGKRRDHQHIEHERRITRVERNMWYGLGVAAVVFLIAGLGKLPTLLPAFAH